MQVQSKGALAGSGPKSPWMIKDPDLDIRLMFARVRDTVLEQTHKTQEPFTYGSLPGEMLTFAPTK